MNFGFGPEGCVGAASGRACRAAASVLTADQRCFRNIGCGSVGASMLRVRAAREADGPHWRRLWSGYQTFYGVSLPKEVTDATWARFFVETEPARALLAEDDTEIVGLVHFLFHRSTWMIEDTCYLQDLFVVENRRGRGIARALIEAVYAEADRQGGRQVYWLTHKSNALGRRLYDRVAVNSGFLLYERFAETSD